MTSHAATPERSVVVRGDYAALADCAYQTLDIPQLAGSLRKVDLAPARLSKIEANPSGTVYWNLTFHETAKGQTEIVFRPVRNMWGSDAGGYAELVWPAIETCARR
jgi:hypothetical protein